MTQARQSSRTARGESPTAKHADGRAALLATLTEKEWLAQIIEWAHRAGWRTYHVTDSRRSAGGFPDLVLVKPGHPVIFAELKTIKGRVSPQQRIWLDELEHCPGSRVFVWRPDQEDLVKAVLGLRSA